MHSELSVGFLLFHYQLCNGNFQFFLGGGEREQEGGGLGPSATPRGQQILDSSDAFCAICRLFFFFSPNFRFVSLTTLRLKLSAFLFFWGGEGEEGGLETTKSPQSHQIFVGLSRILSCL